VQKLHHYIGDAMTTWGDVYDFRHFLPRILEIYALDDSLTDQFLNPEIVLREIAICTLDELACK